MGINSSEIWRKNLERPQKQVYSDNGTIKSRKKLERRDGACKALS